jgi:hypothetical protein
MRLFFSLALIGLFTSFSAQETITYPYNPDGDADGSITVPDLQDFLGNYGNNFSPQEILIDGINLGQVISDMQTTIQDLQLTILEMESENSPINVNVIASGFYEYTFVESDEGYSVGNNLISGSWSYVNSNEGMTKSWEQLELSGSIISEIDQFSLRYEGYRLFNSEYIPYFSNIIISPTYTSEDTINISCVYSYQCQGGASNCDDEFADSYVQLVPDYIPDNERFTFLQKILYSGGYSKIWSYTNFELWGEINGVWQNLGVRLN